MNVAKTSSAVSFRDLTIFPSFFFRAASLGPARVTATANEMSAADVQQATERTRPSTDDRIAFVARIKTTCN